MSTLPKDLIDIIQSYMKETESEEKFRKRWLKMSFEQKQEMKKEYGLLEIDPFSMVRNKRFSVPKDLKNIDIVERVLDHALLNEIPDYDEDMVFVRSKEEKERKTNYFDEDVIIIARSSVIAMLLYTVYLLFSKDTVRDKDISDMLDIDGYDDDEEDYSIDDILADIVGSYGMICKCLEGPFFLKEGSKNKMITSNLVYSLIEKARK